MGESEFVLVLAAVTQSGPALHLGHQVNVINLLEGQKSQQVCNAQKNKDSENLCR